MPTIEQQRNAVKVWLGHGALNLFGFPFAGKDTQCLRLSRWLDGPILGGGDILRKRDDLPPDVKQMLDAGLLIPVEEYLSIVTPYLAQADFESRPLILSSVGRFRGEEESILQALERAQHPTRVVIELDLDEDLIWKRWEQSLKLMDRGYRAEDDAVALKTRLSEFRTKTQPVLDFYQKAGLLIRIDGGQDPDAVERDILEALYARAQARATDQAV
jgi:adenylate kinase